MNKAQGGKRKGSGRKKFDPKSKRISITFTLDPKAFKEIKQIAAALGKSRGQVLEVLLETRREFFKLMKQIYDGKKLGS